MLQCYPTRCASRVPSGRESPSWRVNKNPSSPFLTLSLPFFHPLSRRLFHRNRQRPRRHPLRKRFTPCADPRFGCRSSDLAFGLCREKDGAGVGCTASSATCSSHGTGRADPAEEADQPVPHLQQSQGPSQGAVVQSESVSSPSSGRGQTPIQFSLAFSISRLFINSTADKYAAKEPKLGGNRLDGKLSASSDTLRATCRWIR